MWSKTRVVVAATIGGVLLLWLMVPAPMPFLTTPAAPAPTVTVTPTPTPSPTPTGASTGVGVPGEDTTEAEAAMMAFLTTYLTPPAEDAGRDAWLADLEPVTGSVLLAGLEVALLEQIPTGTPGDPDWVIVGDTYTTADVPTGPQLVLRVTTTADPAGVWRVTEVAPAPAATTTP